jgi:putative nucleotidyltransferase with HDIG domain
MGAYDFVAKPFIYNQLTAFVHRALEYRRLLVENRNYQIHLEDMVRVKSAALSQALEQVKQSYIFTLEALAATLDAREHDTGQHSIRVSKLARVLASEMNLSETAVEEIGHGALLHDIGKIAIPDCILLKPGPLDPDEWTIMKKHPEIGYNILRSSPYLERVSQIVYEHQERFDGSGYPRALRGSEICLGARIFAIADSYDAMRSRRAYSDPTRPEEPAAEIFKHRGKQCDPEVVDAFQRCLPELEKTGNWPERPEEAPPQTL